MSGNEFSRRSLRARGKKPNLNLDLNADPAFDSMGQEGSSQNRSLGGPAVQERVAATAPVPIDVDAFDDDVIISSPTAFAQARNNPRRNRGRPVVVDVETVAEERATRPKRRRISPNQTVINCEYYVNLEDGSNAKKNSGEKVALPSKPPPPKEPTFSCPVCMGPLVEETSTKCGHIFCKKCIKAAIAAQSKCPTCRKKTTVKDIIRVYLPATTVS